MFSLSAVSSRAAVPIARNLPHANPITALALQHFNSIHSLSIADCRNIQEKIGRDNEYKISWRLFHFPLPPSKKQLAHVLKDLSKNGGLFTAFTATGLAPCYRLLDFQQENPTPTDLQNIARKMAQYECPTFRGCYTPAFRVSGLTLKTEEEQKAMAELLYQTHSSHVRIVNHLEGQEVSSSSHPPLELESLASLEKALALLANTPASGK